MHYFVTYTNQDVANFNKPILIFKIHLAINSSLKINDTQSSTLSFNICPNVVNAMISNMSFTLFFDINKSILNPGIVL